MKTAAISFLVTILSNHDDILIKPCLTSICCVTSWQQKGKQMSQCFSLWRAAVPQYIEANEERH